ncbi:regulator of G-protein signaling 10 isoform X3 [Moschus berezovskii]|uniref:regulator of G-protein signaling 10 isoform X3 n=1 Tax=Moschus berezovskii TaxID=68408 RepID=UPI002444E507|nr:regulator of G-protein signaling 10 isoform X3 [Moschus berezovskii]
MLSSLTDARGGRRHTMGLGGPRPVHLQASPPNLLPAPPPPLSLKLLITLLLFTQDSLDPSGKCMQEKAKEIYMTFLSSKASSQVNVEGQSRLNEKILEEPHPLMFQKLQDQIFNLMKYDSYSRFLKSDLFLKHKRTEEEDEESPDAQTAAKRASRIYNT